MMRIVTPKAELMEVMQTVSCIKEKTVSFAEKTKRIVIKAERMDAEVTGIMIGTGFDRMIWGNLSPERVREILNALAEKEFYNFLPEGFEVVDSPSKIPEGRPYFLEGKQNFGMGIGGGMRGDTFPPLNRCEDDCFLNDEYEEC